MPVAAILVLSFDRSVLHVKIFDENVDQSQSTTFLSDYKFKFYSVISPKDTDLGSLLARDIAGPI